MGRIIHASTNKVNKLAPHNFSRIVLEANSALGRQSCAFNLENLQEAHTQKRLRIFLDSNGYASLSVDKFIKALKSRIKTQGPCSLIRMEHLGIKRDGALKVPGIGQSHELEFGALRASIPGNTSIGHGVDFFESSNKLNGVCAFKIVSETLGKTLANATTEFVLGPSATKNEYTHVLQAVDNFKALLKNNREEQAQAIADIIPDIKLGQEKILSKKLSDAVIWNEDLTNRYKPCVHTSRGAPIRAISDILQDPESGLYSSPRKILSLSAARTDEFVNATKLLAPHKKKLWETINLSIWMAACEGIVQPLMQNNINKIYETNKTLVSWTLYAGKNFFGTLPRFSAGDLLRTNGLSAQDQKQLHDLFASENKEDNKKNIKLLVNAATQVAEDFLKNLSKSHNSEYQEIVKILHENSHELKSWIRRDLTSDFVPRVNKKRYPDDTHEDYGNKVNTTATSPSFAGSQYLPRREQLGAKAPVSGAFEFRGSHKANKEAARYFASQTLKRKREALDSSWADFEHYVDRLAKKQRV